MFLRPNSRISFFFLGFMLIIFSANSQSLKRGPYLQMISSNSVTIRWETNESGFGKVKIGERLGHPDSEIAEIISLSSHIFPFEKLKPDTKYFYSLEMDGKVLAGDSSYYFQTAPLPDSHRKLRFAAFGDCGTLQPEQVEVAGAIQTYFKGQHIDGMLLLGDNAYNSGFESEYQTNFFQIYDKFFLKNTALWTTPGNHDYGDNRTWEQDHNGVKPAYYYLFSVPTKGESGGVPSDNQAYYSYNYGNVHFISLDSYGLNGGKLMADTTSQLIEWLKKDLTENKSLWTVIFFHHPPFTKGSHNSDTEQELINIRQNFVKLIDQFDVDLVLNGHSHNYERSFPISGFYGNSEQFESEKFAVSNSSGKYDGTENSCIYVKDTKGTVYVVSGSSGWVGAHSVGYPHKAMVYSNSENTGATILEFEGNRLDLKFISNKGVVQDKFSMIKKPRKKSFFEIECGDKLEIIPSLKGDFKIEGVKASGLVVDSLKNDISFVVKDLKNCVTEEIQVKINPLANPQANSNSPVFQGQTLRLSGKGDPKSSLSWSGPLLKQTTGPEVSVENVQYNQSGTYILEAQFKYCIAKDSIKVEILQPLGLSGEIENEELRLFPNPGIDKLEIRTVSEEIKEILLIDFTGKNRKLKFKETENKNYLFDPEIEFLSASNYFLNVIFKSGKSKIVRFSKL